MLGVSDGERNENRREEKEGDGGGMVKEKEGYRKECLRVEGKILQKAARK